MLCVFNPEHDLCLSNGRPHYVPPASALRFAREGASVMQVLYPGCVSVCASQVDCRFAADWMGGVNGDDDSLIVPWGWNIVLKTALLQAGIPEGLMPTDETLVKWRSLQHRSTILPLQPEAKAVSDLETVNGLLGQYGRLVLKAPWSGSGRGLRWVDRTLAPLDISWLQKVMATQGCVVAEPRREVECDFAVEFVIESGTVHFEGFSLFETEHGVYRANRLMEDKEIAERVGYSDERLAALTDWLCGTVAPYYNGPVGIDYILDCEGRIHVCEMNLRHTMGLVAHRFLAAHPEALGRLLMIDGSVLRLV